MMATNKQQRRVPDSRKCRIQLLSWIFTLLVGTTACVQLWAQTYTYDEAGRLILVAYPQGSGVRYQYDDADNLTSVTRITLPASPGGLTIQRTSPICVEVTWQDSSSNENGFEIMRRRVGNYEWETVAVVGANVTRHTDCSLDTFQDYVYRVAATGSQGLSAYTTELRPADASSAHLDPDVGGAGTAFTAGSTGAADVGYATVTVHYGAAPYGTAVFSVSQNGVVVSEAGVPSSPPTTAARLFIDFRRGVTGNHFSGTIDINTGIAVVNRGTGTANVTYTLRDLDGSVLTIGEGTLAEGVHFARFIDELRGVAPSFSLPADFATATGYGTLELRSDQPLSILALRLTISGQRALITSTPVADLSQPTSSESLYFPQFADGGGFISAIYLLNTSTSTQTGTLEVYADNGSALPVQQLGGATASSFTYSIPPRGAVVFQTDGSAAGASVGWVQLKPDPGSTAPVGAGVFQLAQNGVVVTESGVPTALATTRARIYVDTSSGHDTGLAIANPGDRSITVTPSTFDLDGSTPVGSSRGSVRLNRKGHSARFVGEMISGLPAGFTGVLEISSTSPFVALTLRSLVNSAGDFLLTTLPIADLTRAAPSPVVFPQIADGGGITTQFILISGGGASGTTIRFFGEDGGLLFIGEEP